MAAVYGYRYGTAGVQGTILCGRQYQNSLAESSLQECQRAIYRDPLLSEYYKCTEQAIKSVDGNITFAFAGLERNINSIKSMGRLLLCWADEAEPITNESLDVLEPTLREEGRGWNAELWVTWNSLRKNAAVEQRYRNSDNPLIKGAMLNWQDNPAFPEKLKRQRERDFDERPESYQHVWEGDFATTIKGAYYASHLNKARVERRIGHCAADPLLTYRVFVDIGGTGNNADAFAMWVCQFAGREVRVIDYYEAVGQEPAGHFHWLMDRGYKPSNTKIWLPHDGAQHDRTSATTYQGVFKHAGYDTVVVPNQGKGAARQRINACYNIFPRVFFHEATTQPGLEALGWYHEKRDERRSIGLGPEHDWSSHAADAFGLMAISVDLVDNDRRRIHTQSYALS